MITVQDIKAKKSTDVSGASKIRQSWVLQMPEEKKEILKALPADARKGLYKQFDKEVQAAWTEDLKTIRENIESADVQMVLQKGYKRFEDQYCGDTDEVLIQAASKWVDALDLSGLVVKTPE